MAGNQLIFLDFKLGFRHKLRHLFNVPLDLSFQELLLLLHLFLVVDKVLELEVTSLAFLSFSSVHATFTISFSYFLMDFSFMLFLDLIESSLKLANDSLLIVHFTEVELLEVSDTLAIFAALRGQFFDICTEFQTVVFLLSQIDFKLAIPPDTNCTVFKQSFLFEVLKLNFKLLFVGCGFLLVNDDLAFKFNSLLFLLSHCSC